VIIDVDEIATEKNDELSKTEHYVKTFSHRVSGNNVQRKIFAIDCEMVKTSSAYPELARVSVTMFNGRYFDDARSISTVVLDELVKPCRNVLDYITEYSGISAIMLEDIDTRIEDIQVRLLAMIDEDDIIVGHSLENDLRALRLIHDKVIDTSVIFRGANGRKFSLKHLSNVLLHRKIQCGSHGHCSSEDAEAALVLALRRARHGESFRLKENAIRQNIIGVFQKMNHNVKQQRQDAKSFAERNDGSCVCIGDSDWITKYAQSAEGAQHILSCNSILNTMVMAIPSWLSSSSATKRAGLLWANLRCEDRSTNGKKGQWKNEVQKLDELVVS
jgi:DNA polymerase III epsilon subunit-like protein